MTLISTHFKGMVEMNVQHFSKSRIKVQILKDKKWKPLFEFSLQDVSKIFNIKRKIK